MPNFRELLKKYADEKAASGPQKDATLADYSEQDKGFHPMETDPDNVDKTLLIAKVLANGVDAAQTRYIARNPQEFHEEEISPLIGHHPHQDKVAAYMVGKSIVDALVAKYAPSIVKKGFLGLGLADTANATNNNNRIGIKTRM